MLRFEGLLPTRLRSFGRVEYCTTSQVCVWVHVLYPC
jgi:hypothetical protein